MMIHDDYNMLKSDVIDLMVRKLKANDKQLNENALQQHSAPATHPPKNDSNRSQLKDKMFWGLNTKALDAATATGIELRAVCLSEPTATYMM
jgi:hypothetical protein